MLLVIETATGACSVALLDNAVVAATLHAEVGRGHAERLLPMIAALPLGGRADAILVDCGPGSFTGIRVGIAAARALGLGWRVPVRGYSSLALLAAGHCAANDDATVAIAIPGGHGQVFLQHFAAKPLRALTPLVSLTPADAAAALESDTVVGGAAAEIVALRGSGRQFDRVLDARDAALLSGRCADLPPRPIYGRAPDATPMA